VQAEGAANIKNRLGLEMIVGNNYFN